VDPAVLYNNYSYVTSPSAMMRAHFVRLIADIISETSGNSVLEIGSNDGLLLAMMQESGFSVLGVDPAENLVAIARARGVHVQSGFFGEDFARMLPQSDIVIARHVFCHVDDWHDFIRGLEAVSRAETLICIEVPYAGDMLKNCEFDTVYHEHLSYLTIKSIKALLEGTSLALHRIIRYSIHGGAILLMLRRQDTESQPCSQTFLNEENITDEDWKAFAVEARAQIDRLRATVTALVAQGKRVAGLGASAKSTVWISACGFTRKEISFIADTTPQKQYTFSPGTDIPITDEGAILRELPDYVICFCWNFWGPELKEKFKLAREKGVKFIIPVPTISIV
jgi:novobiocin biosynthesis protein NovU/D-mycarose 3-C-methyltransferase